MIGLAELKSPPSSVRWRAGFRWKPYPWLKRWTPRGFYLLVQCSYCFHEQPRKGRSRQSKYFGAEEREIFFYIVGINNKSHKKSYRLSKLQFLFPNEFFVLLYKNRGFKFGLWIKNQFLQRIVKVLLISPLHIEFKTYVTMQCFGLVTVKHMEANS